MGRRGAGGRVGREGMNAEVSGKEGGRREGGKGGDECRGEWEGGRGEWGGWGGEWEGGGGEWGGGGSEWEGGEGSRKVGWEGRGQMGR